MISKELLSRVLGRHVTAISNEIDKQDDYWLISSGQLRFLCMPDEVLYSINIHELAHKNCKEWAWGKGYTIVSSINSCLVYADGIGLVREYYNQPEQEAIFKAVEWILKETK